MTHAVHDSQGDAVEAAFDSGPGSPSHGDGYDRSLVVLHVSQPTNAGVRAVVLDLLRDQMQRGWKVLLACPEANDLDAQCRRLGATWIPWNATRNPGAKVLSECLRLRRIINDMRPDVVHLHSSKAGLAGRLVLRGRLPTVFEPNGWSFHAVDGWLATGSRWWERFASRWTHSTVCVSETEQSAALQAGMKARWDIVRNGIDLRVWQQPEADSRKAACDRLQLDPDVQNVLCVGRLCRQKGQDLLLRAWQEVRRQHPRARLYLVGDGPDRPSLESLSDDSVTFVGLRSDVRDWFLAADLIAMPSRWEGLSIALLEAMSCARPVIAAEVSGMREAIGETAGVLIPPEDVAALAEGIANLLSSPETLAEIGASARQRVVAEFDQSVTNSRIAAIYRRLLDDRSIRLSSGE
ncbi:MAG: glycosyltransferase family 4 protein [Planctomycetaceae bacterium]